MSYKEYELPSKKFRTRHRDDMYHAIAKNDSTKLFSSIIDTFLMAFAIGFHLDKRESVSGSGSINHTNANYICTNHQDLIILMMLSRYPDLPDASTLWSIVEEYAEYGIGVLYESLRRSEWILDVGDILSEN